MPSSKSNAGEPTCPVICWSCMNSSSSGCGRHPTSGRCWRRRHLPLASGAELLVKLSGAQAAASYELPPRPLANGRPESRNASGQFPGASGHNDLFFSLTRRSPSPGLLVAMVAGTDAFYHRSSSAGPCMKHPAHQVALNGLWHDARPWFRVRPAGCRLSV